MVKGLILRSFRGKNFYTEYKDGQIYDFEETRAKTLVSRGLIEIISDSKKQIVQANEVELAEMTCEVHEETTVKSRGRQRKTE